MQTDAIPLTVSVSDADKAKLFAHNRTRLLSQFPNTNAVIVLEGGIAGLRNSDVEILFRQDSNFMYLTGVELENSLFLLETNNNETTLFIPDRTPTYPVWHGTPKPLPELAAQYGLTRALERSKFNDVIKAFDPQQLFVLKQKNSTISIDFENEKQNSQHLVKILMDIRATKSKAEIQLMQETCRLSCAAHVELMKQCRPGLNEYQLESLFASYTSWRGCRFLAYPTIAGSGDNSAILHYHTNDRQIQDGDLVLIDAGCEFLCYATDITRTFPANGKFTETQKLIYNILLDIQKKLIDAVSIDLPFPKLTAMCSTLIIDAMIEQEFILCSAEIALENQLNKLFMPHGLGHLLGLDVHDCLCYPQTPLKKDMVITIEPGIYFNSYLIHKYLDDPTTASLLNKDKLLQFEHFGGIRIEDDVLVTDEGPIVLSRYAPKEIFEIEEIMKK